MRSHRASGYARPAPGGQFPLSPGHRVRSPVPYRGGGPQGCPAAHSTSLPPPALAPPLLCPKPRPHPLSLKNAASGWAGLCPAIAPLQVRPPWRHRSWQSRGSDPACTCRPRAPVAGGQAPPRQVEKGWGCHSHWNPGPGHLGRKPRVLGPEAEDRLGGCREKPERVRVALSQTTWVQISATSCKARGGELTCLGLRFLPCKVGEITVLTPLVSLRFTAKHVCKAL